MAPRRREHSKKTKPRRTGKDVETNVYAQDTQRLHAPSLVKKYHTKGHNNQSVALELILTKQCSSNLPELVGGECVDVSARLERQRPRYKLDIIPFHVRDHHDAHLHEHRPVGSKSQATRSKHKIKLDAGGERGCVCCAQMQKKKTGTFSFCHQSRRLVWWCFSNSYDIICCCLCRI